MYILHISGDFCIFGKPKFYYISCLVRMQLIFSIRIDHYRVSLVFLFFGFLWATDSTGSCYRVITNLDARYPVWDNEYFVLCMQRQDNMKLVYHISADGSEMQFITTTCIYMKSHLYNRINCVGSLSRRTNYK